MIDIFCVDVNQGDAFFDAENPDIGQLNLFFDGKQSNLHSFEEFYIIRFRFPTAVFQMHFAYKI